MKSSFIWLKIERFKPNATSPFREERVAGRRRQIETDLSVRAGCQGEFVYIFHAGASESLERK